MAIFLATNNSAGLISAFNQAIANHQHNKPGQKVTTWRHVAHKGNNFYTHTSTNWADKAWLRGDAETNRAAFYIRPFEGVTLTRTVYSYYAGHLIETFIRDFPTLFTSAQATPNAVGNDAQF
jgi:hypothetical protein